MSKTKLLVLAIRAGAAAMTAAKASAGLLAWLGFEMPDASGLLDAIARIALSTPVSIIAAMIVGQWIGEAYDARTYRIEGGTGGASRRHLSRRLRFTRLILKRPFWYANPDRITREVERTNRALLAAGISPIAIAPNDEGLVSKETDYIRALEALLAALGVQKTARLSPALKRSAARVAVKAAACPTGAGDR